MGIDYLFLICRFELTIDDRARNAITAIAKANVTSTAVAETMADPLTNKMSKNRAAADFCFSAFLMLISKTGLSLRYK